MANTKTIQSYSDNASDWSKHVRGGTNLLQEYIEKPTMMANLPDLTGKSVICLGCGTGEECPVLKEKGASRVVGIDPAQGLIELAQKSYPEIEFKVANIEEIPLPDESFDFAYSSIVMHYLTSWDKSLKEISRILKPKSHFLFSIIHPVNTGTEVIRKEGVSTKLNFGFEKNKITGEYSVTGDYLNDHPISQLWLKNLEVTYIHRPLGEIISEILNSGFELAKFLEPKPIPSTKEKDEMYFTVHSRIPLVLIVDLVKKE